MSFDYTRSIQAKFDAKYRSICHSASIRSKLIVAEKISKLEKWDNRIPEIIKKYNRKLEAYLAKKQADYDRQCKNDIQSFSIPKKIKKYPKTHNNLLDKLLIVIQKYVRLRDTDQSGYGRCICCKTKIHYSKGNGWHYIPRAYKSVCINLYNINLQCSTCNYLMSTGWDQERTEQITTWYRENLIDKHGIEIVTDLEETKEKELSNPAKFWKVSMDMIKEELEYYIPLVKQMEREKLPS